MELKHLSKKLGNLKRLSEGLKSIISGIRKTGTLMVPEKTWGGRVYPDPTFERMMEVHLGDPDVESALEFIGGIAVGNGFETIVNEEYSEAETAKEIIDNNCKEFGLDQLTQEMAVDIIGYGNCWFWKGNPEKIEYLARISPGTIKACEFSDDGLFLKSVQTTYYKFPANELIWLKTNRIGKTPLGVGILQKLCTALKTTSGETRAPFAEIKARVQEAMATQIEKFSAPNQMWVLPDCPDDKLVTYHAKIQKFKQGTRLAYNKAGATVIQAIPERMRGLDFYAETLWNSFYLALATPYPKLILGGGPGFTEASAKAAERIGERKIFTLQRYLKRVIETEIFDVWLMQEGLDPKQAQPRLNWRLSDRPKMEVLLPLLHGTWLKKGMTTEEWRKILMNIGVDLETKEVPEGTLVSERDIEEFRFKKEKPEQKA